MKVASVRDLVICMMDVSRFSSATIPWKAQRSVPMYVAAVAIIILAVIVVAFEDAYIAQRSWGREE